MSQRPKSILNDVLGPVMRGPSSSHTGGAFRIGRVSRSLFGESPVAIDCRFDPHGSYAPTYKISGVDLAFAAGVLGWEMTDERYDAALTTAAEMGTQVQFSVTPLRHADHPNAICITLTGPTGRKLTLWAKSVGGGAITVYRFDDIPVDIDGKSWAALVIVKPSDVHQVCELLTPTLGTDYRTCESTDGDRVLLQYRITSPIDEEQLDLLSRLETIVQMVVSPPIFLPTPGRELFRSSHGMVQFACERGIGIGGAAIAYEAELLGIPRAEVVAEMQRRLVVMRDCVMEGMDDNRSQMPLTQPCASRIFDSERRGNMALGGPHARAAARAMAVMHVCNSRGVVCAAPTGGSAGVIPAVLVTLEEEQIVDSETVIRALFAASGVGLIVAQRATFAAEIAGCQVEIGVAGAMAAAAVVDAMGGTPQQATDAAAISLQNTMGSICDPVGGGCEIPCHTRNAVAASSAFVCADMILGGYDNRISLDESIDASLAVGKMLPAELRCTARGGIAITPSAQELVSKRR